MLTDRVVKAKSTIHGVPAVPRRGRRHALAAVLAGSVLGGSAVAAERVGHLPRWLPVPAGILASGAGAAGWLTINGGSGGARERCAAATLALAIGLLVAVSVRRSLQTDHQRRVATAAMARGAQAEAEAREGERRLFQFLDAMPVGVFIASPGGQPYYVNRNAEVLLGQRARPDVDIDIDNLAEVSGAYVAGTDQPYPTDRLVTVRALRGEPSHAEDVEVHLAGGGVVPLEAWGRPVFGAGGIVEYGMAIFVDISERKDRERTIANQAALLELAHDAILMRDPAGRISYWNAGAERTYGFTRAEAIGRISHDLLRTEFPEPVADIEAALVRDGRWDGQLVQRRADGRRMVVESRWAAQQGYGGPRSVFMEISRDVTAMREAEAKARGRSVEIERLNATLEERVAQRTVHLEQANKNLEAFSWSVAHDLRTPLRAISGYAEILVEDYGDCLDEVGRQYAGRIQAGGEHMSMLIDELLDLARVTRAELTLEEVDLSAEATAILDELRRRDPGRQVRTTVQPGLHAVGDRSLLRTVLENLLENAWKFTSQRTDATIGFDSAPAAGAARCYRVRDDGVGFDPTYVDKLFQPFQRLHPVDQFPGSGIGLANVRRIVERHGGRTWAEGAVDGGAAFFFTLDAKAAV